jgi:PhnB protein
MTKVYLNPYINFQGRAREAMEFYQKALGGKLELQASNEQGVPRPAASGDRITNARLEAEGALIVGTDGHPNYPAKVGENVAIAVGGTDGARLIKIFNALGEGGQIKMPLTEKSYTGFLADKFNINWVFNIDKA